MTTKVLSTSRRWAALALAGLALQVGAAQPAQTAQPTPAAATASATASADAVYQRERAACTSGAAPQGRATCLKEADAAHAEAKRRSLGNGEGTRALQQNAEARCEQVAAADREHCLRKARGEGTVSGSVDGGGVLKTLVTPVAPAPASAAAR